MRGLLDRLHLDNAKEFRSEALRRGCEQYGITIDYRPVRTPHYGGHIERLIGTMMGKVHLLPGTTFLVRTASITTLPIVISGGRRSACGSIARRSKGCARRGVRRSTRRRSSALLR